MVYHFTMSELLHSDVANCRGWINIPTNPQHLNNLFNLITECLEPIRLELKKPMIISSGYRSTRVNNAVGGAHNSQHLQGMACDFTVKGMSVENAFNYIRNNNLVYDQLIKEQAHGTEWVHISYIRGLNRREDLIYKNGKYTKV